MSETDSFIDEVTEEVRRDRLFLLDEQGLRIAGASVADAIALVLDRTGYTAALEKEGTPEAEARLENLRELLSAAEPSPQRPR